MIGRAVAAPRRDQRQRRVARRLPRRGRARRDRRRASSYARQDLVQLPLPGRARREDPHRAGAAGDRPGERADLAVLAVRRVQEALPRHRSRAGLLEGSDRAAAPHRVLRVARHRRRLLHLLLPGRRHWAYYFAGAWTYEREPSTWLERRLHVRADDPAHRRGAADARRRSAPPASSCSSIDREDRSLAIAHEAARAPRPSRRARGRSRSRVRHGMLAFVRARRVQRVLLFAGQPTLRRLPAWVVTGWGAASSCSRRPRCSCAGSRAARTQYVHEKFAQKILKKWEWGDAPPSDDLKDIYLLHTERTKQREARLRAYKETVREMVADGLVTRDELVILDACARSSASPTRITRRSSASCRPRSASCSIRRYQGSVEQRARARAVPQGPRAARRRGRAPRRRAGAGDARGAARASAASSEDEEAERARADPRARRADRGDLRRRARRDRAARRRRPRPRTTASDARTATRRAASLAAPPPRAPARARARGPRARRARGDDEAPRGRARARAGRERAARVGRRRSRCSTASTPALRDPLVDAIDAPRARRPGRALAPAPILAIADDSLAPRARGVRDAAVALRRRRRRARAARAARRPRADRARGRGARDRREEPADARPAREGARTIRTRACATPRCARCRATTSQRAAGDRSRDPRADHAAASASPACTRRSTRTPRWRR